MGPDERGYIPSLLSLPSSVKSHFRRPEASGSHALGPSGGYSRIQNDIRTDKKDGEGRDTRLKGIGSVNFHLDDSISPSPRRKKGNPRLDACLARAALNAFPPDFLGIERLGRSSLMGSEKMRSTLLRWEKSKRWDVCGKSTDKRREESSPLLFLVPFPGVF